MIELFGQVFNPSSFIVFVYAALAIVVYQFDINIKKERKKEMLID
jgi:hypothetical protein